MFFFLAIIIAVAVYMLKKHDRNKMIWAGGAFVLSILFLPLVLDQIGLDVDKVATASAPEEDTAI